MTLPLHHLVYQSVATTFLGESELGQILAHSRAWNSAHGLSPLARVCDACPLASSL